jgi:hypothetical protein
MITIPNIIIFQSFTRYNSISNSKARNRNTNIRKIENTQENNTPH